MTLEVNSRRSLAAVARMYRTAALIVMNTMVAFVLVNLVLAVVLHIATPSPPAPDGTRSLVPGSEAYEAGVRSAVRHGAFRDQERFFPLFTPEQVAALMLETWLLRPYVYESFTQFKEGPYRGRFVNVDVNGFRHGRAPAPWPPDSHALNVFVFGGSTIFGYGLPDDQTVPARLEEALSKAGLRFPLRVYNFARGYYFSTQERVLFEQLIASGTVPDVAVFVDGLNDFYNSLGEPQFTGRLRAFMAHAADPCPSPLFAMVRELPIGRAARWVAERAASARRPPTPVLRPDAGEERREVPPRRDAARADLERVIDRFIENKRMIEAVAATGGVRVLFVWQPVPTYKYDLRYHPFAAKGFGAHENSRLGYPRMAEIVREGRLGRDFLSCADIQEGLRAALYIDQTHYAPRMASRVARCIAKGMIRRGTIATGRPPASPTGDAAARHPERASGSAASARKPPP